MRSRATAAVAADPDVGRRVVQCGCGMARAWTGREGAIAMGWSSRWIEERRRWFCPSCSTPPAAAAPTPVRALSWAADLVRASLGDAPKDQRQRAGLLDLLRTLAQQSPSQCALTVPTVEAVLRRRRVPAARWWREQLQEVRALLRPAGASPAERTQAMFAGITPPCPGVVSAPRVRELDKAAGA